MQNKILKPYTGLSLRKGTKEVNIHYVKDGVVHWGLYEDGDDLPHGLPRGDIRDWILL